MAYTVYILHSPTINKFYIGSTADDVSQRLRRHLSDHHGFTARAKDWSIAYSETFENKTEALKREKEIKNWRSSVRIKRLIVSAE